MSASSEPAPVAIAVAIVRDGDRVLVARRPMTGHLPGLWEFPGGKVRDGEAAEAAARREAREEVGLALGEIERYREVEHAYAERTVRIGFFLARARRGEERACEGQELRWVDLGELAGLPMPDANRDIVRSLVADAASAPALGGMSAPPAPASIEREIKLELAGRADHDRAVESLSAEADAPARAVAQRNHYFDTRDLRLAGALVMLRLRKASGRWLLTLKSGTRIEAGAFESIEVESPLDDAQAAAALARPRSLFDMDLSPIRALVAGHGPLDLACIATLENTRTMVRVAGRTIEIDAMRFDDGREEFEIEIESDDPAAALAWCRDTLERLAIPFRPSTETKFQRVLRHGAESAAGDGTARR